MSHARSRSALIFAVLAVAATSAYFAWRGSRGSAPAAPLQGSSAAQGAERTQPDLVAGTELTAAPDAQTGRAGVVPEPQSEQEAASALPWEASDAVWVTGRVEFAFDAPADEELYVVASTREMKDRDSLGSLTDRLHEYLNSRPRGRLASWTKVKGDGSFRIALPAGTQRTHLAVSGNYVYALRTTAVDLPSDTPVALTGELGAWLTGTLTTASEILEAAPAALRDVRIELDADTTSDFDVVGVQSQAEERDTQTDEDGRFHLRALSAIPTSIISALPSDHLAATVTTGLKFEAGRHHELTLTLTPGATIRGRVIDARGDGVEDAKVEARMRGAIGQMVDEVAEAKTASDGSFELRHVPAQDLSVTAEKEGFLDGSTSLRDQLVDGGVFEGLVVELEEGLKIHGQVVYPDGSPANKVIVRAKPDPSQLTGMNAMRLMRLDSDSVRTSADGHFTISGLPDAVFELTARKSIEDGERAGDWSASSDGLKPGTEPVTITLSKLLELSGRFVDADGNPIEDFEVRAIAKGSGGMFGIGAKQQLDSFEDREDGSFTLKGIEAGTWTVDGRATGYANADEQDVTVPQADGTELVLTLRKAASVSGRVIGTGGEPVANAEVRADLSMAGRMEAMRTGGIPSTTSEADGTFLLTGLEPGEVSIKAHYEGFAASEAATCTVESGQEARDLVLQLRLGGSLAGQVLDDEGQPAPGRRVTVQLTPTFAAQRMLTTDANGEFRTEHLEPGTWQVVSTRDFLDDMIEGDENAMGELMSDIKMEMVEILDGEDTYVVIGSPPKDPVNVIGRVTHSGEPVENAIVSFVPEDSEGIGSIKMKMTDDRGQFDVRVDEPGTYLVTVQQQSGVGAQNSIELTERIPDGIEEHRLEIELPTGRISGTVRGPGGEPLAACRVSLNVEGGLAYGSMMGGHYAEVTTDGDGKYDITGLRPATYVVAAGGVALGGMLGGDSVGGRELVGGIVIEEGEWREAVDFELKEPGNLKGIVRRADGSPAAGATVFVRDANGRALERFSFVTSSASGEFTYKGLTPGEYTAHALGDALASPESAPVNVPAGGAGHVELKLEAGTLLRVLVEAEGDELLRGTVSVTDDDGREVTGMLSMKELMESFGERFSGKEQRVGPLPSGRYLVTFTRSDGSTKKKPVTLRGQEERKLKLRLK